MIESINFKSGDTTKNHHNFNSFQFHSKDDDEDDISENSYKYE